MTRGSCSPTALPLAERQDDRSARQPPRPGASAQAINDAGLVVGAIQVQGEMRFHAVIWKNGRMIDISTAGYNSEATAVNNRGQVAGWTEPVPDDQRVGPRPFRWKSGHSRLFTMPYPGYNMRIIGIDATGRIVASIVTDEQAILLRSRG